VITELPPSGAACTDAERRAAVALHDDLRTDGHEAWLETVWVRPQDDWSRGLHALLAVIASLLSPSEPIAGAALAGIVLLSLGLETAGLPGLLRLLFFRRATQLVLVEADDPDAVALWIVARTDVPRRGTLANRLRGRIAAALVPGPGAWLMLAVAVVAATAGARIAGVDDSALGIVQFIPTVALVLVVAAALDTAAGPRAAPDGALAAARQLHAELVSHPPRHVSAALVLAGARPHGLRAHLRRERPDPAATVILELRATADDDVPPVLVSRHGQLRRAAEAAGVPFAGGAGPSRRLPSATLAGSSAELLDAALAVTDELDAQLGEAENV